MSIFLLKRQMEIYMIQMEADAIPNFSQDPVHCLFGALHPSLAGTATDLMNGK